MAPISLDQISLRRNERGLLIGGTGSGKTTLADLLRGDFLHRYYTLGARCLIVDTKPRYRAQYLINGLSAAKRYKTWDHGPMVAGSVVVDDVRELKSAWRLGHRIAIVQCTSKKDLPRVIQVVRAFLEDSRAGRPQLVQFDEIGDFYHGNGIAKGGDDVADEAARAGRERGTSALFCGQRTIGISSTLIENLTRGYFMVLDAKKDARRITEMGAPEFVWPENDHEFMYWTKLARRHVYGPYKLALPAR